MGDMFWYWQFPVGIYWLCGLLVPFAYWMTESEAFPYSSGQYIVYVLVLPPLVYSLGVMAVEWYLDHYSRR
jgi:hypothetical protein